MANSTKKQLAKSNLIKSLSIGGGITAVTTTVGLAVSIPVYKKIQDELKESASAVADLSKFMSELTNKLGIPEGQTFEKELAGGYTLVYSDGKTQIFAGSGDGKSLVMNMNADGTVGSAAQMQGPSAQKMLGVIAEAKDTLEGEGNAMSDIMADYSSQALATSLHTESAITGASIASLVTRNALSTDEPLTPAQKADLLAEAAKAAAAVDPTIDVNALANAESEAQALIDARNKRLEEEQAERQASEEERQKLIEARLQREKNEALA